MSYKLGLLLCVAWLASLATGLPPCVCTRNLRPVCGSDGQTYSNECMLDCARSMGTQVSLARQGSCDRMRHIRETPCACTFDYKPVCGTDEVTYPNQCSLDCLRNGVSVKHAGACGRQAKETPDHCICTLEYLPLCGTDGVTYPNRCSLECKQNGVSVRHAGECGRQRREIPVCACARNLRPVCGSDRVTYNNLCLLNCAAAQNSELRVAYEGDCADSILVAENPEPKENAVSCICTRNYEPICGSDGVTYNNECYFNCAADQSASLTVEHDGTCVDSVEVVESTQSSETPALCPCARNYEPVCGSDGVTYGNECYLKCAIGKNSQLRQTHEGVCVDKVLVAENSLSSEVPVPLCICARNYQPVCGSDGVTYSNECYLNCATVENPQLRVAHEGDCVDSLLVVEPTAAPLCICARNFLPTCGSDGVTYSNQCFLNCAAGTNPQIRLKHMGECSKDVEPVKAVPRLPSCACTRMYRPVCGSNGVTYGNSCMLRCAARDDDSLRSVHSGQCEA